MSITAGMRSALRKAAAQFQPGARSAADEAAAEAAIRQLWEERGKPAPVIHWASSPADARRTARAEGMAKLRLDKALTPVDVPHNTDWWEISQSLRIEMPVIRAMPAIASLVPRGGGHWDGKNWVRRWETQAYDVLVAGIAGGLAPPLYPAVWRAAVMAWQVQGHVLLLRWPLEVYARQQAGRGVMHRYDGPALVWPDGEEQYFFNGRRVTAWLLGKPALLNAVISGNVETRREEIERIGWDVMQQEAGLHQVGEDEPDPGNPGQVLQLWEFPPEVFAFRERVLVCINGSDEPDGTRRKFMLFCGQRPDTPLKAAAALARMKPEDYATMKRRT